VCTSFEAEIPRLKNAMESIYFFLSSLPNQSQKFKYQKCASFEAEIQDSKIQWKCVRRGRR